MMTPPRQLWPTTQSAANGSTCDAAWPQPVARAPAARPRPSCGDPVGMSIDASDIEHALRSTLAPTSLDVQDDSHLHVGHAGAREGRHFSVQIASPRFRGLARVARHRLVYDALHDLMPRGIHALSIDARVPDER